ncbi:MAG: sporulation protein YunB [Bacilli bacterium]|nr:sporulation protein YunB [Bacilli bacterium]MDD3304834.1 sporulation protein YunB [Bacilli bacterium]MDD4053421.1 sporulation protein YunB [Bacilli bacterium]MDD4410932.1 sporulation protein YunB [Bacilli bacterium]
MKRMKTKRKRKFDKINQIIIVIILLFLSITMFLGYINAKLSPLLLDFAEIETAKFANLIINRAVTKQITNEIDIDKLFSTIKNNNGEIQTVDFNPTIVNKVLNMTTNAVHSSLKAVEEGKIDMIEIPEGIIVEYDKEKIKKGIIFEIPLGAISGNAFIANLGPKIPVKLNLIGSVNSNINTRISEYGINNALIEVYIKIEVTEKINLPLSSKDMVVSSDIPIAMKIVQGKIPEYYNNSGLKQNSSVFTLPIQ